MSVINKAEPGKRNLSFHKSDVKLNSDVLIGEDFEGSMHLYLSHRVSLISMLCILTALSFCWIL